MELTGTWRAVDADEALRRAYHLPGFADEAWEPVPVPAHWRSVPAFAASDGPLLYRTAFEAPRPPKGRRAWLTFDGVFYQGDVWLDGGYVGDTEGYYLPHTFEVTGALRDRTEHVLAAEVTCARPRDLTAKRNLTGVFQHWDCIDPDWNPGGIWRSVRLEETGPVRIRNLRVRCAEASPERAVLILRASLDTSEAGDVRLRTTVGASTEHVEVKTLALGENRVEWRVIVEQPQLWWPHALGDQPLHEVTVEADLAGAPAAAGSNGAPSHRRSVRTGLRQVRMRRWIFTVNGERLFLKGSNQGPSRMALGEATAEDLRRDVRLAVETGLDLLRLHAHVSRPELYEAADQAGLLLWQDLPLQWGYARGVRREAVRQARAAVDVLAHHPSLALWCGHNEPLALDVHPGRPLDAGLAGRALLLQQVPTWNKTVLDRSLKRALERADGTRPVIAHSGVLPHPGSGGTDSHLYFGWYWGEARGFHRLAAWWPHLVRFVSEFGAQAVPGTDAFLEPDRWPDLDWERLARTHGLQRDVMARLGLDPGAFASFDDWRRATQDHQAEVIALHVEHLRRLKYRPTGGFAQFSFADSHPAVSWSVLDHERVPKAGHRALAAACSPVIVAADPLDRNYRPGDAVVADVHVVSDLRTEIAGVRVEARLEWDGGDHRWAWEGDVPADGCVRVGTVQALAPDHAGPLTLHLRADATGHRPTRVYRSQVIVS